MLIILIKPLTTKAYDRRASGDCGTSGRLCCHRGHSCFTKTVFGLSFFEILTRIYICMTLSGIYISIEFTLVVFDLHDLLQE